MQAMPGFLLLNWLLPFQSPTPLLSIIGLTCTFIMCTQDQFLNTFGKVLDNFLISFPNFELNQSPMMTFDLWQEHLLLIFHNIRSIMTIIINCFFVLCIMKALFDKPLVCSTEWNSFVDLQMNAWKSLSLRYHLRPWGISFLVICVQYFFNSSGSNWLLRNWPSFAGSLAHLLDCTYIWISAHIIRSSSNVVTLMCDPLFELRRSCFSTHSSTINRQVALPTSLQSHDLWQPSQILQFPSGHYWQPNGDNFWLCELSSPEDHDHPPQRWFCETL